MRAILANEFGGPDVLQFATVPSPTPGMGELLIQIEACGVCFHDLLTRTGLLKRGVTLPFIPGARTRGTCASDRAGRGEFRGRSASLLSSRRAVLAVSSLPVRTGSFVCKRQPSGAQLESRRVR